MNVGPHCIGMEPLRNDPGLQELIERHGELELVPAEDPFQRLVVSIVNQQLSTQSAAAIKSRLFDGFTITPDALLDADEDALREVGLSRQKIEYIKNAAERFIEDDLTPDRFQKMSDTEVIDELTQIKGIGVWTAKMFLIFVLGREDVFPVEDLGIRNGMTHLYGEMTQEDMATKAEDWRPYRSIASLYLWKAVDGGIDE